MDFMQPNDDEDVDYDDMLEPVGCDSTSQGDLSVRTLKTWTLEMTPDATWWLKYYVWLSYRPRASDKIWF